MSSSRPRRGFIWKLHVEALAHTWQHLYPCLPGPSKSPDRSKTVEESFQLDQLSSCPHCTPLSRSKSQCKSPPSILCTQQGPCHARSLQKTERERVTVTASDCEQCTLWESVSPDKRNDDDSYQLEKECQVSLVFAVLLTPQGPSPISLHNLNLTACVCFLASLRKHRNSSSVLPFCHIGILK